MRPTRAGPALAELLAFADPGAPPREGAGSARAHAQVAAPRGAWSWAGLAVLPKLVRCWLNLPMASPAAAAPGHADTAG